MLQALVRAIQPKAHAQHVALAVRERAQEPAQLLGALLAQRLLHAVESAGVGQAIHEPDIAVRSARSVQAQRLARQVEEL